MRSLFAALGAALLASACGGLEPPPFAETARPALYGADDRQDAASHPDPALRARARASVLALVDSASVADGRWPTSLPTLGDALELCPGQRFADHPVLPFCTAVLVGPDQVLTARHCVPDAARCASTALVFGFALDADGHLEPRPVVFRCAGLVDDPNDRDVVRVRLDRAVDADRTPLSVAASWSPALGDPVTVIGHPSGLPLQIDDGGRVRALRGGVRVTADAFGGSSGSPVLDGRGALVGLLTAGNGDYRSVDGCTEAIAYHPDEVGEAVLVLASAMTATTTTTPEPAACACTGRPAGTGRPLVALLIGSAVLLLRRARRHQHVAAQPTPAEAHVQQREEQVLCVRRAHR